MTSPGNNRYFVTRMNWHRACRGALSDQRGALKVRDKTAFSRMSRSWEQAGQSRMVCSKLSWSHWQREQVGGFSRSNQQRWAARWLLPVRSW